MFSYENWADNCNIFFVLKYQYSDIPKFKFIGLGPDIRSWEIAVKILSEI